MKTSEEFDIQPLNNHILIQVEPPKEITDGGIILPDQAHKPTVRQYQEPISVVLKLPVGLDRTLYPLEVGDKVIVRGGTTINRGQENLVFARVVDIVAVLKQK
jgi:co-chaperonin GroES (HSP10)